MSNLGKVEHFIRLKVKVIPSLLSVFAVSLLLSSCGNSGSPTPVPTKTVYLPAPTQNNGTLGGYSQNDLEDQLESARQAACDAAQEIQWQWIQLSNQINELDMNGFNGISGNSELDRQVTQLRFQVIQLQQQESNLRQQCEG
jgi:hypothetical protein